MLCDICKQNDSIGSHSFVSAKRVSYSSSNAGNWTNTSSTYFKHSNHDIYYCKDCKNAYKKRKVFYSIMLFIITIILVIPLFLDPVLNIVKLNTTFIIICLGLAFIFLFSGEYLLFSSGDSDLCKDFALKEHRKILKTSDDKSLLEFFSEKEWYSKS